MKKIAISVVTASMLFAFSPATAKAGLETNTTSKKAVKVEESAQAQVLLNRLEEIKDMDVSAMSPSQKNELQKEVKTIQNDLQGLSGGVYFSATALIVILLLILILA